MDHDLDQEPQRDVSGRLFLDVRHGHVLLPDIEGVGYLQLTRAVHRAGACCSWTASAGFRSHLASSDVAGREARPVEHGNLQSIADAEAGFQRCASNEVYGNDLDFAPDAYLCGVAPVSRRSY